MLGSNSGACLAIVFANVLFCIVLVLAGGIGGRTGPRMFQVDFRTVRRRLASCESSLVRGPNPGEQRGRFSAAAMTRIAFERSGTIATDAKHWKTSPDSIKRLRLFIAFLICLIQANTTSVISGHVQEIRAVVVCCCVGQHCSVMCGLM